MNNNNRDHTFRSCAKVFDKQSFFTPEYTDVRLRINGKMSEMSAYILN